MTTTTTAAKTNPYDHTPKADVSFTAPPPGDFAGPDARPINTSPAKPRLTPQQVAKYREQGYLIYDKPVLPPDKFQGLRNRFEEILSGIAPDQRPEAMDVPHFVYPDLMNWVLLDDVLDLVEPILGPDIILFASHFICKPRGNGRRVPWHEDSAYWKGTIEPIEVCTVWLAIDPSTRANGCMKVIPRSHNTGKAGYSDYEPVDEQKNVFSKEIIEAQRDESRQVAIELQPNFASLHDGRLIHGSDPNTSDIRRCGYTMRFMPATVKLRNDRYATHKLYLARGRDRAGNFYGDPTKAYPDIARFRMAKLKHSH